MRPARVAPTMMSTTSHAVRDGAPAHSDVEPEASKRFTTAERRVRGKAARSEVPRSAHGGWEPTSMRRDPVELLEEQARTRLPELVPIRYGRMLVSPFTFFRGAAYIMAADLADGAQTGLHAQLCGDAHLSNFGIFAAPDRRLVFSINDFDETSAGAVRVGREAAGGELHCRRSRELGFDERTRRFDRTDNRARLPQCHGALCGDAEHRRLVHASGRRRNRPALLDQDDCNGEAGAWRKIWPRLGQRTACGRSPNSVNRLTVSCGSSATAR